MNPVVETRGWRERLEQAIDEEYERDSPEHEHLTKLADRWTTCAVGENREVLKEKGYKFYPSTAPMNDTDLDDLGMDFAMAVANGAWDEALEILEAIQSLPTLEDK